MITFPFRFEPGGTKHAITSDAGRGGRGMASGEDYACHYPGGGPGGTRHGIRGGRRMPLPRRRAGGDEACLFSGENINR